MGKVGIITKAEHVKTVARRWAEQYPKRADPDHTEHGQIRIALKAMKSPTVEKINELIGNDSWTRLDCEICEKDAPALICFSDGYSRSISVCALCAAKAVKKAA